MKTILAATNNQHKLHELRTILGAHGIHVLSAADVGGIPDVDETGATFVANACLKAEEVAAATGRVVFADDSGLEVTALDGEPGIRSARYGGGDVVTDVDRMQLVLERLGDSADRSARFVCVIALASPDGIIGTAEGEVRGRIAAKPNGDGGFGYDPIFIPEGHDQSFAELGSEIKDSMSHRSRALAAALDAGLFDLQMTLLGKEK